MSKRCAFSGHRPFYFPWKENESDPACIHLKAALEAEINKAVADGFFYLRDCYMVDASERMIIVYDDDSKGPSGTKDALLYARSSGVEIRQIQWMHL